MFHLRHFFAELHHGLLQLWKLHELLHGFHDLGAFLERPGEPQLARLVSHLHLDRGQVRLGRVNSIDGLAGRHDFFGEHLGRLLVTSLGALLDGPRRLQLFALYLVNLCT